MSHLEGQAGHQQCTHKEAIRDDNTPQTIRTIPELKRDSSREELATTTLLAALELDDRPSFAIPTDIDSNTDANAVLDLVYCNPALANATELLNKVTGKDDTEGTFVQSTLTHQSFRKWLWHIEDPSDRARRGKAYMFEGYIWTSVSIDQYRIFSGLRASLLWIDAPPSKQQVDSIDPRERKSPKHMPLQGRPPALPSALLNQESTDEDDIESMLPIRHGPYDVTFANPPPSTLSSFINYFRSVDWAQTPLGPMHSWAPELRGVVNMCLADIHPCVLFWGDEVIMIYNEAYIELIGVMHPCLGQSAKLVASEYWHSFQPLVDHVNATGTSVADTEIPLFIDRHGFLEETYWSFELVPVLNDKGDIGGYYQLLFDVTQHNLLKRRVASLVELGGQTANVRKTGDFWNLAQQTLALNDKDVPFALLYSSEDEIKSVGRPIAPVAYSQLQEKFILKGSIGVDPDHPIAPSSLTVTNQAYILHPYLLQASISKKATVVHLEELGSPCTELDNINWRGFGDPSRVVVVCPILPTEGEIEGFLILGINPRRPFDADYQRFIQITLRLFSTSLASVVLFSDEVRQKEKAIDKAAEVEEQLLAELQMKEKKFQRFAERSDVGIFIMDSAGKYTYRNQRWYELFNVATNIDDAMAAWLNIAFPEDIATCEAIFGKLVMQKEAVSFELKTKMHWTPPSEPGQSEDASVEHFRWILCSAYPELGADGQLVEIVGNVTDISKPKWAEGIQKLRTDSALESKQHLEHFIDTTSHEMRNPLSAIMQSADGILSSISPHPTAFPAETWSTFIEQILDAAQTIAQCSLHMKHIVDDILTISKLDSGLLAITPVHVQAEGIGHHAVKMFEAEAKAADVTLEYLIDQSYRDMEIDWVSLDPTRLLQVLINLLTNAIKFTRLEKTRCVSVVMSASNDPPGSVPGGVQFIEHRLVDEDRHLEEDWKLEKDLIYIQFSVTDTGRGLSEEERGSLFTRFSQASPRTHIHYGGSGLGLFIARRLTELQGGAIGLASEVKKGSIFSFYIKTRRVQATRVRKGSLPNILPEDVRHRPGTPLSGRIRPPPPLRVPSHQGSDGADCDPPSPRMLRQSSHQRHPSFGFPDTEAHRLPPTPELHEQKQRRPYQNILHVLVVEDNLINQRVLAKQLRNLGCEVHVSNHGGEALDFLRKTVHWNHEYAQTAKEALPINLSVILMDWEMPIMSGLTAVAKIREMEDEGILIGRIPVIGVTANVRQQQIETAMTAGMDDVVAKPFRVAELLVRMRDVVRNVEVLDTGAEMFDERMEGG